MSFTAQDVAKLRAQTGVGMMECKKALTDANGDFEQAVKNICNLKDVANYESIKNNSGTFQSLINNFDPATTLYVSNSTCLSNGTSINKIVYLTINSIIANYF